MQVRKRTQTGIVRLVRCWNPHAIIRFSDWFAKIMETHPSFFLGGYDLHTQCKSYEDMFSYFWDNFEGVQATHPVYMEKTREERARCVPIALHGDEGRGLNKVPVLIVSFQVVIPSSGADQLAGSQNLSNIGYALELFKTRYCHSSFLQGTLWCGQQRVTKAFLYDQAFVHSCPKHLVRGRCHHRWSSRSVVVGPRSCVS